MLTRQEARLLPKHPVAQPQQHRHVAGVVIGDRQVEPTVTVKISFHDGGGSATDGKVRLALKRGVADA